MKVIAIAAATSEQAVCDALMTDLPQRTVDLSGRLDSDVESLPGYEGLGS
ncbi:MAG: hypothetical protein ACLQFR_02530 [Streptosporangiaceae bacterium]